MNGLLYLEDGTIYKGEGFGYPATRVGELVFNTSMTGYQEILTDPSYMGQIINMTYPLMGNYGICMDDNESDGIYAFGLVARDVCFTPSNHNAEMCLDEWLKLHKIPGVWNVDTRRITRMIRSGGTVKCVISSEDISPAEAKTLCENTFLRGDWMKEAGTKTVHKMDGPCGFKPGSPGAKKVAVLDFGVKANILHSLCGHGCQLTVFPYHSTAEEILSIKPDGIFLTNGPGDPAEAVEAVETVKKLMQTGLPIFGICMGHQVLALAAGGRTFKLKYGHRGGNHGVYDKERDQACITSQNHGYAVSPESIVLKGMEVTHINLNDGTVEGMRHRSLPVFSVQFHPEASPGPGDSGYLFAQFMDLMD